MKHFILKCRRPIAVALHIGLIVAANTLAFSLRFGGVPPQSYWNLWIETLPWLVLTRAVVFVPFRLYEGLWRYTSITDLRSIGFGVVVKLGRVRPAPGRTGIPYPGSIILIDTLVLIFLMGGARLSRGAYRELLTRRRQTRVLIYGGGDAGEQIVRNMHDDPHYGYHPVGFVDDDPAKVGGASMACRCSARGMSYRASRRSAAGRTRC